MFKIGFRSEDTESTPTPVISSEATTVTSAPRKSVVQVKFPGHGSLAYYNDLFDLHVGDLVYVDGKLEGIRGRVTEVNYNFKIKLSEYKRVISLVDTTVHGELFNAGSHFVSFDPSVIPATKIRLWFNAPTSDDDDYVSGSDDTSFPLDALSEMKIAPQIASRGHEYYLQNHVKYLCLDNGKGYAIVEGTEPYEVEFAYMDGQISGLTCSCFCSYNCKHEFAAMLQLSETMKIIEKHYADCYARTGYFAAILKSTLFSVAIDGQETGSVIL